MESRPGATLQHALMGLFVTVIADCNLTLEDIKKQIHFVKEAPFIKVDFAEKYMACFGSIADWVMSYVMVAPKIVAFIEKLNALPEKCVEIGNKAKDDLIAAGLGPMDVMKIMKATMKSLAKIKDVVKTLIDDMKKIPIELKAVQEAGTAFNKAIESGELTSKAKAAREAGLTEIVDVYEHAFGKIPEPVKKGEKPKGKDGKGESCCCTTF